MSIALISAAHERRYQLGLQEARLRVALGILRGLKENGADAEKIEEAEKRLREAYDASGEKP